MGLEKLKIENNDTLDAIVAEMESFQIEIETNNNQQRNAKEVIQSLDENKLAAYIEKSFKNEDNEWLTYSEMKNNKFYPFMVQASIDLLSNKLKNTDGNVTKYDHDWNVVGQDQDWKTLDEWIDFYWWIDNIYGVWTQDIVEMIQKIYELNEDWLAGPQFFAKVCSVLKWENYVRDFKVKWYDDKPYKYWFENKDLKNNNNTEAKEIDWYKINLNDWITIWKYKDWMWYELNIPGVEWEFYAYKWRKDGEETILFWDPTKESGIWDHITVERTEWWITVKLKEKNKINATDKAEPKRESNENIEQNTTKINDDLYKELMKKTESILKDYIITPEHYNPEFRLVKYLGTEPIDYKFNFHDFLSSDGKKLDEEKLKETVESKMNELIQEREIQNEIKNDNNKFLSNIRWKIYSIEDILWEWYDKDDLTLKAFLSKFDNNKVEIDKDTKIEWDTLILEFDIKWKNKESERTIQKIELQDIINTEGKIDEQLFNKKLAEIINEIVNYYFSA